MLTVLAATLGRVPTSVMRSKLAGAAQLLAQVAAEAKDQVRPARHGACARIKAQGRGGYGDRCAAE